MDFNDFTRRTKAHEQINIRTQAINPSNEDTFVILIRGNPETRKLGLSTDHN
jgi:hypothetical protein